MTDHSDLSHALIAALCGAVLFVAITLIVSTFIQFDDVLLWIWRAVLAGVALPFLFVVTSRFLLILKYAEAEIERLTGTDLNHSGAVGDMSSAPTTTEPVPAFPILSEAQMRDRFVRHAIEFYQRASIVGHERSQWIKNDGAKEDWVFQDREKITQPEYRLIMLMFKSIGIVPGRTQGAKGEWQGTPPTPSAEMVG